jgi:hypothetical protein
MFFILNYLMAFFTLFTKVGLSYATVKLKSRINVNVTKANNSGLLT